MPGPRSVVAKTAAALPAVAEAVRDFRFPLSAARVDGRTRTLVLPFERKHPRPEDWELVVRGARSVVVKGRVEQDTDFFRALRHDAGAGVFEIEGVLVRVRVQVDSLDVEARCLTPEERTDFDVADLPTGVRREMEKRESDSLKGRERYEKADRERVAVVTATAALAALVLGAGSGMPVPLLPFEAALGGAAGLAIARRRIGFFGAGAAIFGIPTIALSLLGILLTRGTSDGNAAGLGHGLFWSLLALAGTVLALLNRKLMDEVQGLSSRWEDGKEPPKPLDLRIPGRAAAIVGLGGGVLHLVFGAPWAVWAAGSPLGAGGAAWLLARFQARPSVASWTLGGIGTVLSFLAVGGGEFVPAALLIAAAHFAAGMMVAYHSRGEGPR